MAIHTDLAVEMRELNNISDEGIIYDEFSFDDIKVSRIEIIDENGESKLKKPKGNYVTLETPAIGSAEYEPDDCADILCRELDRLIEDKSAVLVCGIGNRSITPDALGPKTADNILATRHITGEIANSVGLNNLKNVSVLSPGVLGQTGMELWEILLGVVERIKPSAVIVIDALAARNVERLGKSVQLTDTGITPGSGVHNARHEISAKTLNIPVISIGIPTVVDLRTIAEDMKATDFDDKYSRMIVTPREIDVMIERASKVTAMAINRCLQPDLSAEDIAMLVG